MKPLRATKFLLLGFAIPISPVLLVALIFTVAYWPFVPSWRLHGVKGGMTEAEVLEVMGEPNTKETRAPLHTPGKYQWVDRYHWIWWTFPSGVLIVEYGGDGKVVEFMRN